MKWLSLIPIAGAILLWVLMFSIDIETHPPTTDFVKFGFCLIMTSIVGMFVIISESDDRFEKI